MKYIKMYADQAAYDADNEKECPHVGYIEDTEEVKYINDMADLYDIYGTVTDGTASMTIKINGSNQNVTVSNGNFMYNWTGGTITSLRNMFQNRRIKTLDKFVLDTSNVTNMNNFFGLCYGLTSADLSGLNTSAVTDIGGFFSNCNQLTSLNLSNFDTSSVTNTKEMFYYDYSLTSLNLSNWDTSAVSDSTRMFNNCRVLSTITMNNTNTTTFDMIKAQLVTDNVASHVTIIRDGVSWTYNGSQWVSQ